MNCPNRNVLLAFRTGELPETEAEEVISHISVCPECQTTLHALGNADDTLAAKLRSPAADDPYKTEPEQADLMARAMAIVTGASPVSDRLLSETREPADLGRLGEYELLTKLGEGGMGAVYKARQTRLDKIVAIKVLPKQRTADPQAVARFECEMKAVGRVSHPNIVQAHDARDIEGTTVLVMEYVDGQDLSHVVKRLGILPIAEACEIARQTALGLQAAHDHGLVHRDIKPSNLMLSKPPSPSGRGAGGEGAQVKILDLGLARLGTEQSEGVEFPHFHLYFSRWAAVRHGNIYGSAVFLGRVAGRPCPGLWSDFHRLRPSCMVERRQASRSGGLVD